jgi:thiamine biosynthesis lipoprotein
MAGLVAHAPASEWRFHADGVLGTRLDVFVSCASALSARCAADAAMAEITRLQRLLSRHDPESELSRLNASEQMNVSPELFEVLTRAAYWREVSGGAFDERLGLASQVARAGDAAGAQRAARHAVGAQVRLVVRHVAGGVVRHVAMRGAGAVVDLDAIAKGYVIDRAMAAARAAARDAVAVMVAIGGDMAAWRADAGAWRIGLPEAGAAVDNAPLAAVVDLAHGAMATSGRGPRDVVVDGRRIGPALADGAAVNERLCATARAACAMDADALATIALVLPPAQSLAIAEANGSALRIVDADGKVHVSPGWTERPAQIEPAEIGNERGELVKVRQTSPAAPMPAAEKWPADWRLAIWYRLPERRKRDGDFREPYMAIWITDSTGKAVRTLFMVGQNPKWQKDNFIWWGAYRAKAETVIDARSEATAPTGRYAFMWDGYDDAEKKVAAGTYTIHIETSRERGRHTHRAMEFVISKEKFQKEMPADVDEGGFTAVFGHYNDLLDFVP